MNEKHHSAWPSVENSLRTAALLPQQRGEMIACALQELLTHIPATATALIWPCQKHKVPWKVYYAGARRDTMRQWLSARLDASLDVTTAVIQHDLSSNFSDMPPPLFTRLQPSPVSPPGLWIIWASSLASAALPNPVIECLERVRRTLEALLEVEGTEEQYFFSSSPLLDQELTEGLAHGDTHALSAFLSLTRVVGKADFTFWARAYQDIIEITGHLGAKHNGFGFALPLGRGVGGRIAAYGRPIVGDYRNSPYRDPSVCDMIDGEDIRSGLALPVRYHAQRDSNPRVAAVLYVTRRTTTPFSLAERLLVQRLAGLLEPLPFVSRPPSFTSPGVQRFPDHKAAWYDIILYANRVETLEAWVSQIIKGTVIVTDGDGHPYVFAHTEELEQMREARDAEPDAAQVISLAAPGVSLPGKVYMWPSMPLPPPAWPDFFSDLVIACNLVIARQEEAHDHLARQRGQWLRALLQGKTVQPGIADGYRLGLPVERGQIWVIAWPAQTMQAAKSARKRMIAESITLDNLKSPLIFFDDDAAVVLLDAHATPQPSRVRDALLKHCAPHPLWIVYGARYHSLHELKMTLTHAITLAQRARREKYNEYLLDIHTPGLDSLLENPRLSEDLRDFATRLLAPLTEYDAARKTHLTTTFVLAQTLGSAQAVADQLAVHVNTIRYRLHKVEEILGIEQASPKEHTALALAAFIWKSWEHGA
ncbi:MAG TPA: helix-turn-helix domain-containing protein [Ktedonobacteraceae bacterium]|nr:helix-turn-helix domain-containing protein [Ktedonobacteraceae bacterium]